MWGGGHHKNGGEGGKGYHLVVAVAFIFSAVSELGIFSVEDVKA